MLYHDPLEEFRRHPGIPNPLWVDHDNRPSFADAQARRFASFCPVGAKEKPFALKEPGKQGI